MRHLKNNEVLVLYAQIPVLLNKPTDFLLNILSSDEQSRYSKFRYEKDRQLYFVSRLLLRMVLSCFASNHPSCWSFSCNTHGKPQIEFPKLIPKINFNVSHTEGFVAIAFTTKRDVGIDIEQLSNNNDYLNIANRYFASEEYESILQYEDKKLRQRRFVEIWTLKEAYVKARGLGLSIPLNEFSFFTNGGNNIEIKFDRRIQDEPNNWRFFQFYPIDSHCISVAVKSNSIDKITFKLREFNSLEKEYCMLFE